MKNGLQYFEEYKAHAKNSTTMSIFEINGNPAIGWETGTKKDIVLWNDNGTIISERTIPYPAEIRVIDPVSKTFYMFKGFTSLDELKKLASSVV